MTWLFAAIGKCRFTDHDVSVGGNFSQPIANVGIPGIDQAFAIGIDDAVGDAFGAMGDGHGVDGEPFEGMAVRLVGGQLDDGKTVGGQYDPIPVYRFQSLEKGSEALSRNNGQRPSRLGLGGIFQSKKKRCQFAGVIRVEVAEKNM